jgi:hypothetical protein
MYAIHTQRFEVLKGAGRGWLYHGQDIRSSVGHAALLPLARQMQDDPAWTIDAPFSNQ